MRTSFSTCTNGYHYDPLFMWEKENEQVEKKNKDPFEQVEQVDHMQLIIRQRKEKQRRQYYNELASAYSFFWIDN